MKILAVAQDPGGAEVLAATLVALPQFDNKNLELDILGRGGAVRVFESAGVAFSEFGEEAIPEHWSQYVERLLHQTQPDVVLTATSSVPSPERVFIRAAKKLHIPSISILDSWANYLDRFLEPGETQMHESFLPTYIGAPNRFGHAEMEAFGFPPHILRVVGHPAINVFLSNAKRQQKEIKTHIRKNFNLNVRTPILVFFSQPIEEYHRRRTPGTDPGYSEIEVLMGLIMAVSQLPDNPILIVKPHPKEPIEKFQQIQSANLYIMDQLDSDLLAMAADVVISMTSGMLVKAFLIGKQVLSIQPNLRGYDQCVLSRAGCISTIGDTHGIFDALRLALSGQNFSSSHDFDWDVRAGEDIARISELIKECGKGSG